MAIVSLITLLDFCDVDILYFVVDGAHDVLKLTDSTGGVQDIEVDDDIYTGTELASELQSKARTGLDSTGVTVDYSTTGTKKFTITATGETMTFTLAGSDAALLFGFNQDHLTAAESITSDIAAGDPSTILESIRDSVEDWVENYCHRTFEATLYVKERHDGDEQDIIYFDQSPVLAINLDSLAWDSTGTVTRDDGGSFVSDGFTSGDSVLVQNSDSNSGLLTIDTDGVAATVLTFTDTITTDSDDDDVILSLFRELWINDTEIEEDDYRVFNDHIYYNAGFSEGHGNIRLSYYAGYSSSNMPSDLKLSIKIIVKSIYDRRKDEIFGTSEYGVGDIRVKCEDGDIPKEAINLLSRYRRILI